MIGVAVLPGERGRGGRGSSEPTVEGVAVVGNVNVIGRDAGTAGIVLARPAYHETRRVDRGRQRQDVAGRIAGVDRIEALLVRIGALAGVVGIDLVGGDSLGAVEGDFGHVADLSARGQARLGAGNVRDIAHAAAGAVLGRQEADVDRRGQTRIGIDRAERGIDLARIGVDAGLDLDVEIYAAVAHRHCGFVVLREVGHGDFVITEADARQFEGRPVDVAIELIDDLDLLGGGRRRGVVLKINTVGKWCVDGNVVLRSHSRRASLLVGVDRSPKACCGDEASDCTHPERLEELHQTEAVEGTRYVCSAGNATTVRDREDRFHGSNRLKDLIDSLFHIVRIAVLQHFLPLFRGEVGIL